MTSGQDSQKPHRLFIQMSGAPGSGKSTMVGPPRGQRRSFDEAAKQAYRLQWRLAEDEMKQGYSVIIDNTCNLQEIFDRGTALVKEYEATHWYVECKVEDIDLLDERLRKRASMKNQQTSINSPPAAARSARLGQDSHATFRRWNESLCPPEHNVIIVDSTGDLEKLRDHILE